MNATDAEPQHVRLKPNRDSRTWLSYAQLSIYALFLYGFGATQALLRDEQGITPSLAGLYGTGFAIAGIVGGVTSSRLVASLGRGVVLRVATIVFAVGLAVFAWPGVGFAVSLSGLFIAGIAGTWLIITLNAFLLQHQGAAGPAALTEANALAAGAGLFGPLLVGIGAATVLGWRIAPVIVIAGLVTVEVVRGRNLDRFGAAGAAEHAEHRKLPLPRRVYWSLALIMCLLATEFSMTFWGADLLREHAHFGAAGAAASIATIVGGMLIGRTVGARLAQRIPSETLLRVSIIVALGGFALAWIPTSAVLVLTGLFITGLGLSVHWPLGVARAVRLSDGMTDRASALSSLSGSVAIATAPFVLGTLADAIGFHTAFLMVPLLLGCALAILIARPAPEAVS